MSRSEVRRRRSVGLVGLMAGVLGFTWYGSLDGAAARPESVALPNQWQWRVPRVPATKARAELRLVVRSVAESFGEVVPPPRRTPIPAGEGVEKVLGVDHLPADGTVAARAAFQAVDVREFGAAPCDDGGPLRAVATLQVDGAVIRGTARLAGHSVRCPPTLHAADWADGELPLMTLITTDETVQTTYTLALVITPVGRR